jgi:hypothetical protein
MELYTGDLLAARNWLRDQGGWLLEIGGEYLATDDEGTVRDMRGEAFLTYCEDYQRWDETQDNFKAPTCPYS